MDTVGPMARDIAGTVAGMDLLSTGFASRYAAARARVPRAARIRIGRLTLNRTDPAIDEAIDRALAAAGFQVIRLDNEFRDRWEQAKKDGNTVAAVGIWMYYERFRYDREVSARTKGAMLLGRLEYGSKYRQALARGLEWSQVLQDVLTRVDFIALPTMQTIPPRIGIDFEVGTIETRMLALQNTVPVNIAGNPALSVPVPLVRRDFPVTGLQLIGRKNSEADLLNAGRLIETALHATDPSSSTHTLRCSALISANSRRNRL
jgi:Asp-tRNA(Asn)/Glu-tRNA(Gln) amidotransferase A subunit family amidase